MLKKIIVRTLLALILVVAVFAGVVAVQPADYRVERSAAIAAPPAVVFGQVNDFHNWEAWSPWAKLDPACKNSFEGPSDGTGAVFAWSGNDQVGEGRMTITESRPAELVRIDLHFIRPFEDSCLTEFTFKPEGDQTVVNWNMAGHKNFLSKAVCLFMNMDKMLGGEFEKGLASMKAVAESSAKNRAAE